MQKQISIIFLNYLNAGLQCLKTPHTARENLDPFNTSIDEFSLQKNQSQYWQQNDHGTRTLA